MSATTSAVSTLPTTTINSASMTAVAVAVPTVVPQQAPSKCFNQTALLFLTPADCNFPILPGQVFSSSTINFTISGPRNYYLMSNNINDTEIDRMLQERARASQGGAPCDLMYWSGYGEDGKGWLEVTPPNTSGVANTAYTWNNITLSPTVHCFPGAEFTNVTSKPLSCFIPPASIAITNTSTSISVLDGTYLVRSTNLTNSDVKNLVRNRISTYVDAVLCESLSWINAGEAGLGTLELNWIPKAKSNSANRNAGMTGLGKWVFLGMALAAGLFI
ncbi:hypothetical protein HDU97_006259 [Phlyctochytrium planicorne]|nr:hypothetical protein HDU97_006259 [Phlyctochytrium planicorne]